MNLKEKINSDIPQNWKHRPLQGESSEGGNKFHNNSHFHTDSAAVFIAITQPLCCWIYY